MGEICRVLLEPWDIEEDRRTLLNAVIRHVLAFTTWRSLAAGGLDDEGIGAILVGLVEGVASGTLGAIDTSD